MILSADPPDPSWRRTIRQARDAIADVIEGSQSLHSYPAQRVPLAYRRARRDAADDTGLPLATYPRGLPVAPAPGAGGRLLARGVIHAVEQTWLIGGLN